MQHSTLNSAFFRTTAALVVALLVFADPAQASGLDVQPSELNLSAVRPATDILLRNTGSEASTVSFEIRQWSQSNGRERLEASSRLIVHPERVTVEPGKSVKVRVGLRLSGPRWEEEAFRVMVTESSRLPDVGHASNTVRRKIVQRASIPLFLRPPGQVNPRLHWSIERNRDGQVLLHASNSGKAHVQLHSASLLGPAGHSMHKRNLADYLLPGGQRSWVLATDAAPGIWQLTAHTDAGPMKADLKLAPNMPVVTSLSQAR